MQAAIKSIFVTQAKVKKYWGLNVEAAHFLKMGWGERTLLAWRSWFKFRT